MAETVNYVIQRGDLYCTVGCVAALLLYARYPRLRFTGLYLLPLVLALLSKPPAAVFPLLLFFYLLLLLAAISITASRCRLYPIAFGLIWFIVTQLPTSLYPLSEVENDHRMFFSFVGLMLAAVWAAWLLVLRLFDVERRE